MVVSIEAKTIGQNSSGASLWEIEIVSPEKITFLRDLIESIIREEVACFNSKNHQNRLSPVLSLEEIEEGQASGKIGVGGNSRNPIVDPEMAIERALKAFEEGHYYVFVNGSQISRLEDGIYIDPNCQIKFIKLTPLIGG